MPVLVIDTEESFRAALAGNLRDDGHAVLEYGNPRQLPPMADLVDIPVIITDYETPGENGLALADRWHAAYPGIQVIMVTAHWSRQLETQVATRRFMRLLSKPVDYEEVHRLVHELAGRRRA